MTLACFVNGKKPIVKPESRALLSLLLDQGCYHCVLPLVTYIRHRESVLSSEQ
jgi:hypothetical protein